MNETRYSVIGVDIGGTNLRGALIVSDGMVVKRFRTSSAIAEGYEAFFHRLLSEIETLREYAEGIGSPVRSIGMGIPGLIDSSGVILSSVNLLPLEGSNLRELLEQRLQLPVSCANDANLIALGEHCFGAGMGLRSLVVITIGTGLGSGLVLDGRLWEGARGLAAEIGHVTVEPDGLPCPCGNHGCLEQYVSASALIRLGGGLPPEELAQKARNGDVDARRCFDQTSGYLGIALAGLLNTLNLQGIIIGGGVSASYDLLLPGIRDTLHKRTFPQILEGVVVRQASLGDDAGLLGAASLAMSQISSRI